MMAVQDKFAGASKRVLDINCLADVLDACQDCAVNWNPLGLKLGLSPPLLDRIAATTNDPIQRLQSVLDAWLRMMCLPSSPNPSYYILCHAVATGGRNPALAEGIAAAHPASDDDDDGTSDIDTDSNSSTSVGYYTDEDLKKLCTCGDCSLQKIVTEGCPVTGERSLSRFPLLNIKRIPQGKRQQYLYMMIKDAHSINEKFDSLCDDIRMSLQFQSIPAARLKTHIRRMQWFQQATDSHELLSELNDCTDIDSVFFVLSKICSWFNHHPLEPIVNRYGTSNDKKKYKDFVENTLMTYLKRSIREIPKEGLGDEIEGSGKFQLKMDSKATHENIRGEHIIFLKASVAKALEVLPEHFHIVSFKEGCIEVTFMVPLKIYVKLFPLSDEHCQALQDIAVSLDELNSLKIQSAHWYDDSKHRYQKKVFHVNMAVSQGMLLIRSSSDIHTQGDNEEPREVENLQDNYVNMQTDFAGVLVHVVQDLIKSNSVEDIKIFLLALNANIENDVKPEENMKSLIVLLRKYCNLSNFSLLKCLARHFKLDNSTKMLRKLAKERDEFYKRIRAVDFAEQVHVIDDHMTPESQKKMVITASWSRNTTLHDFDEFLKKAFQSHQMFILLRAVHQSLLTFVCTIPSWLVDEVVHFVSSSYNTRSLKSRGVVEVSVDNTAIPIGPNDIRPIDLHVLLQKHRPLVKSEQAAKMALISLLEHEKEGKELRILVTGKTGQGKSALINGILGVEIAEEGAGAKKVTNEVDIFSKTIENVPIKVFDSPGLQDRTANEDKYIEGMVETCKELSLVLYCTKMVNTRLTDDDKNAMTKLTRAFGEKFWNYAVFVLTFANWEDVSRKDDRDANEPEPDAKDEKGWKDLEARRFQGRLKLWKEELQRFLIDDVGVSAKIAQEIPVIPTGDHKVSRRNPQPFVLPDRDDWFNDFWKVCCLHMKDTSLFLRVNYHLHRLRVADGGFIDSDGESENEEQNCHSQAQQLSHQKFEEKIDIITGFITASDEEKLEDEENTLLSDTSQQKTCSSGSSQDISTSSSVELPPSVPLYKRHIDIDETFSQSIVIGAIEQKFEDHPEIVSKAKSAWRRFTNKTALLVRTILRLK